MLSCFVPEIHVDLDTMSSRVFHQPTMLHSWNFLKFTIICYWALTDIHIILQSRIYLTWQLLWPSPSRDHCNSHSLYLNCFHIEQLFLVFPHYLTTMRKSHLHDAFKYCIYMWPSEPLNHWNSDFLHSIKFSKQAVFHILISLLFFPYHIYSQGEETCHLSALLFASVAATTVITSWPLKHSFSDQGNATINSFYILTLLLTSLSV